MNQFALINEALNEDDNEVTNRLATDPSVLEQQFKQQQLEDKLRRRELAILEGRWVSKFSA